MLNPPGDSSMYEASEPGAPPPLEPGAPPMEPGAAPPPGSVPGVGAEPALLGSDSWWNGFQLTVFGKQLTNESAKKLMCVRPLPLLPRRYFFTVRNALSECVRTVRSYALSAVAVTSVIALVVVISSPSNDAAGGGDVGGGSPAVPAPAPIFGGSRPPSGRPPPPALWSRRPPPPPPPRDTPTYDLTIGYCRGGPAWEEPHAWAG